MAGSSLVLAAFLLTITLYPLLGSAALGADSGDPFIYSPIEEGFKYRPSARGGAVNVTSLAWSPDRPKVFAVGAERWVALVSAEVGREVWINRIPVRGWVAEVAWAGDLVVAVAAKRAIEGAWINVWETALLAYTAKGELAWLQKYSGQPVLAVGQGLIAVTEMDAVEEGGKARMTDQRVAAYTFEGSRAWSIDLGGSTVVLDAEWSPSGGYLAVEALVTDNPVSGEAEPRAYKVLIVDSQGSIVAEREYPAGEASDIAVAWGPGDVLAVAIAGPRGSGFEFIDASTGKVEEAPLSVKAGKVLWAAWPPSGEALAAFSSGDGEAVLIAAKPGGEASKLEPRGGVPRYKPKWSPDGALAVNLSGDGRFIELRDGGLNLLLGEAGAGFMVLNERVLDTLIQWIRVGEVYMFVAKRGFNEVQLYKVKRFSVVTLEGEGLSYKLCLAGPGLAAPACMERLGGTSTIYLKPGSYEAEVKFLSAEARKIYGPAWNVSVTFNIEVEPFESKKYDLVGPFMEHVGTLEIAYDLPKRIDFTLRILGLGDGEKYYELVGVQGKGEEVKLRVKLVEGAYKVVVSTRVTGLPAKLEREVAVKPGETVRVDVTLETLGIGKLVLLGGAIYKVALSDGTEVYEEMIHRGQETVLYLPAGTYKVTVSTDPLLLGGIEILGPGGPLSFTKEASIEPAGETVIDPLEILERNLARLVVENARGEAVTVLLVPYTQEGELVEMANLIALGAGERKEYFIMPGYNYKVIDQEREEVITEISPRPGEIITLTIGERGATQETQTPTQTPTTPTQAQTTGEEGGEEAEEATETTRAGEAQEAPGEPEAGGGGNTLLLAGVGAAAIILLLIAVGAMARRR